MPEYQELKKIIKIKENFKPNLIIAIGGGCVMDLAKISSNFNIEKNLRLKIKLSNLMVMREEILCMEEK